jgi:hypothetical protein
LRRAVSGLAIAALGAMLILGTVAFYEFSTGVGAATVTSTSTVYYTGPTTTLMVQSTKTDTVSSLGTSTSTTTLTSTQGQTSTKTVTETSVQTITETSVKTVTQTTGSKSSTSTSGSQSLLLEIDYFVTNQSICQSGGTPCDWSGTLSWPTSTCDYVYPCQSLQIAPRAGSYSYPVTLGECGISVDWSLSMTTPANESSLSVTVENSAGAVVYQQSTPSGSSSASSNLVGSYAPC